MNNINNILEKYWEGESSLQEEQVLKEYFASGNIADEHQAIAPLWGYMNVNSDLEYDHDLTDILAKGLESEASQATDDAPQPSAKVFSLKKWIPAVAALFVAVFAVVGIMNNTDSKEVTPTKKYASNVIVLDGEADSEEALKVTREALAFLSGKLNKSSNTLQEGIQNLDKLDIMN